MSSKWDYAFYDRNSRPCTLKEWSEEFSSPHMFNKDVRVKDYRVLTKWTGVDMPEYEWLQKNQFSSKNWKPNLKPSPFVSYVWNADGEIVESKRYQTIERAYKGHADLIERFGNEDLGVYHVPVVLQDMEETNGEEKD
jgi:hypothetical protein